MNEVTLIRRGNLTLPITAMRTKIANGSGEEQALGNHEAARSRLPLRDNGEEYGNRGDRG